MNVPVSLQMGGKRIRIEYIDDLKDGDQPLSGRTFCFENHIQISKAKHKTARAVFSTLFHELCHVAFEVTGHSVEWTDAMEEPLVYALESMMADLFVFSPAAKIKWKDVSWPGEDE